MRQRADHVREAGNVLRDGRKNVRAPAPVVRVVLDEVKQAAHVLRLRAPALRQ